LNGSANEGFKQREINTAEIDRKEVGSKEVLVFFLSTFFTLGV
jgi:hypothetical protein